MVSHIARALTGVGLAALIVTEIPAIGIRIAQADIDDDDGKDGAEDESDRILRQVTN